MQQGGGQFTLDGEELAELALCARESIRVESFQSSAAPAHMRYFGIVCSRPGRYDPTIIKSPACFKSDEEARGYGEATLESALGAIEHLRAQNPSD